MVGNDSDKGEETLASTAASKIIFAVVSSSRLDKE
jgi:hypothetical protein